MGIRVPDLALPPRTFAWCLLAYLVFKTTKAAACSCTCCALHNKLGKGGVLGLKIGPTFTKLCSYGLRLCPHKRRHDLVFHKDAICSPDSVPTGLHPQLDRLHSSCLAGERGCDCWEMQILSTVVTPAALPTAPLPASVPLLADTRCCLRRRHDHAVLDR